MSEIVKCAQCDKSLDCPTCGQLRRDVIISPCGTLYFCNKKCEAEYYKKIE